MLIFHRLFDIFNNCVTYLVSINKMLNILRSYSCPGFAHNPPLFLTLTPFLTSIYSNLCTIKFWLIYFVKTANVSLCRCPGLVHGYESAGCILQKASPHQTFHWGMGKARRPQKVTKSLLYHLEVYLLVVCWSLHSWNNAKLQK